MKNFQTILLLILISTINCGSVIIGNGNKVRGNNVLIHNGNNNQINGNGNIVRNGDNNNIAGNGN